MDPFSDAGGFSLDDSISGQKKDRPRGPSNLTPLTCGDIANITGEKYTFLQHQAEKVSLCGVIRSLDISSIKAVMIIDDRTGPPVTCQSMDVTDTDLNRLQVGDYVKVYGILRHLSPNKDEVMQRMLTVIKVRPCATINHIAHHMIECSRAKLGYVTMEKRLQEITSTGSGGTSSFNAAGSSTGSGSMGGVGESGINGLTRSQDTVYLAIKGAPSDTGIHLDKILPKLAVHGLKPRDVKDAIEFLSNEGHIYTTLDDQTFACSV